MNFWQRFLKQREEHRIFNTAVAAFFYIKPYGFGFAPGIPSSEVRLRAALPDVSSEELKRLVLVCHEILKGLDVLSLRKDTVREEIREYLETSFPGLSRYNFKSLVSSTLKSMR